MNRGKIFRKNLTSVNKQQINDNLKSKNSFLRPNSTLKKKELPIKLLNKNNENENSKMGNENLLLGKNTTNLNIYYNSDNINNLSYSNEYLVTNNNQKISFSHTESNIFYKRAKTATDRFKIKLENITNMFKNEPKIYLSSQKKITFKHRGLIPGIPRDLLSRLHLIFTIFKNPNFINYMKNAPPKRQIGIDDITEYLSGYKTESTPILYFYALIFYYLCTNIHYDINKINTNEKNLNNIFKSGFANSLQFCKLYEYICKKNLLRIKRIEGFCKSKVLPYYKKGTDVTVINHYWNAIYINKEWYFCDLTFGSGGIKPRNDYKKNYFSPYFFLTPPDNLI